MMRFRVAKTAIQDILGNAAANRYQVIGFQRQEKSAIEFVGSDRLVEVYFKNENFPKSKGSHNGPNQGLVSLAIELTVSAASSADLSVINNDLSTPLEIQTAITAMKEASNTADELMDELSDIVYQVIMDARNIDLGLEKGEVTDRWVSSINKNDPNPRGQLVLLTGFLEFSCQVSEDVPGDTGEPIDTIDIQTEIENDTVQKTGLEIKYI